MIALKTTQDLIHQIVKIIYITNPTNHRDINEDHHPNLYKNFDQNL